MNLLNQAKKIPNQPGVYIFLNGKNKPLYVGRAASLKRRVINYFQKGLDPRIGEMVESAAKIKYKKTDNLLEAVVLEANLIKKYWPKYNIKEKDNRSFVYIVFPKTDYPRPFIIRKRELEKFLPAGRQVPTDRIFGPYQSLSLIKNGLRIIRRIFPYSTCLPCLPDRQAAGLPVKIPGKPCFDYQIGLCPGACVGKISKEDYQKNIDNLILFLKGEKKRLFKKLRKENPAAIQSLKHMEDVSLVSKDEFISKAKKTRIEGYDISHLTGKETYGSMAVFTDTRPDKTQYRLFKIKNAPANDDLRALEEMITRRFRHAEWLFPDLILIDGGKPQIDYLFKVLKKINIAIPFVGISKYAGDKMVFPAKTRKSAKELISAQKNILLKVREEAHRFAIKASRRKRQKMIK